MGSTSRIRCSVSLRMPFAREAEPDETHFERPERPDHVRRGAANRTVRGSVHDVRDHPLPLGFRHALEEQVDAEVELVVAERGEVEPRGVERRDHLLAFEDG